VPAGVDVHVLDRDLLLALAAMASGAVSAIDILRVKTGGTDFQREVWTALRAIPVGETTTYGRLAALLGRPKARRAVGMANGANPVDVVVPCQLFSRLIASLSQSLWRALFEFDRVVRDSVGGIDHCLLTSGDEAHAGAINVLNQ
jgi:O-6-methylguanine DNA methyltransferase